jgi:PKD domain
MGPLGRSSDPVRTGRRRRALVLRLTVAALAVLLAGTTIAPVTGTPAGSPAAPAVPAAKGPGAPSSASPDAGSTPAASADCSALATGWEFLDAERPAPAIAPSLESPCSLDPDVNGLYFVSTTAGSGDRVEFVVTLPANGTNPAGAYAAVWFGMWLTGIGCSYAGASYLTVELIPPYATAPGVAGVPWWTVEAPVWDLVTPGSCDPQCENSTAFVTIAGRPYCEDDAVVAGPGALSSTGNGAFDPGDELTLALVGTAGGSAPLSVWLNDTTAPARSMSWNYSGFTAGQDGPTTLQTVTGTPLVPMYATATSTAGGWTGGLDIGTGWYDCPTSVTVGSLPSACDSYDGAVASDVSPAVSAVVSWNASAQSYDNFYPSLVSASSSGACAGVGVASCSDFATYAGSGAYPTFGIGGAGGRSWITESPDTAADLAVFGSTAAEFPANASLSAPLPPTAIGAPTVAVGSTSLTVSARVVDPWGVNKVGVEVWWCNVGTTRSVETVGATLSTAAYNTPEDGNWTATVPTNSETGSLYYAVTTTDVAHVTTVAPVASVVLTTGSPSCGTSYPTAPAITGVTPVAGGYVLDWSENVSSDALAYNVTATRFPTGMPEIYHLGDVATARIEGLAGNATYNLTVTAVNPAGFATTSPIVRGGTTLYPLAIRPVNVTVSSPWAGLATAGVYDNVTGGEPPFDFHFDFGDGSSATVFTSSGDASTVHDFAANYSGVAVVQVSVNDSDGDTIEALPVDVPVQGPPLGVPATMSGGSGFVQLRWTPPASNAPIVGYKVYWTTDAAWAPYLTSAWPSNDSAPEVSVAYAAASPLTLAVPDGTTVYAQIVAWNFHGQGLLPTAPALGEEPVLAATASTLTGSIALASDGGPAPFTDQFNASFTLTPGDALVSAQYRFSEGPPITPTLEQVGTTSWANGSATFETPGLVDVYLYVTDLLGQATTLFTTLYVGDGPNPVVELSVAPSPVWVNSSVQLTAHASDGSGSYAYAWTLGDGGTATGPVVNYSYDAPGSYVVTVAVTDTVWGGSAPATVVLVVHAYPTVAIVTEATSATGTYRFTAITSGGLGTFNYTWLFGDGATATGVSVTHAFASAGNYTVTVQAKDAYGQATTDSSYVDVPSGTGTTSPGGGSGASTELVGALVVAVIALAVIAGLLALRAARARRAAEDGEDPREPAAGDGSPDAPAGPRPEEEPPFAR